MPNTKSAERRVRSDAKKTERNKSVKSRVKTLEKRYQTALAGGNKETATTAFRTYSSAVDKAVKTGTIHKSTANRKKSRSAVKLAALS
jgi:small subunit ribosomal protein S20